MAEIIIEDNDFVTLWFHTDGGIVHHKVKPVNPPYSQHYRTLFRSTLMKGVALLRERGAIKWLSEDTDSIEIPPKDVAWGQEEWAPKAIISGWRYWAMVIPKDMMAKMNSGNIGRRLSSRGVTLNVYSSVVEAFDWLRSIG